jgi:hypothetical protein
MVGKQITERYLLADERRNISQDGLGGNLRTLILFQIVLHQGYILLIAFRQHDLLIGSC